MRARDRTGRELQLWDLANSQFGLLRHENLVAEGVTRRGIDTRLTACRLTRVHHRVYALGHTALLPEARWLAAVWACAPGGVLSHLSAAAYHRMRDEEPDEPVHVSTRAEAASREGMVVHRVRYLAKADVFSPHPLLVTHIPRTLIDLADVLEWDEYRKAADQLPKLQLQKVKEAQYRAPGRRGAPLVTRLIEADDAHTKSEFERRFLKFSRAHSLPRPDHLNVMVAGQLAGRLIMRLVWDDLHADQARRTAVSVRELLAYGRTRTAS